MIFSSLFFDSSVYEWLIYKRLMFCWCLRIVYLWQLQVLLQFQSTEMRLNLYRTAAELAAVTGPNINETSTSSNDQSFIYSELRQCLQLSQIYNSYASTKNQSFVNQPFINTGVKKSEENIGDEGFISSWQPISTFYLLKMSQT